MNTEIERLKAEDEVLVAMGKAVVRIGELHKARAQGALVHEDLRQAFLEHRAAYKRVLEVCDDHC